MEKWSLATHTRKSHYHLIICSTKVYSKDDAFVRKIIIIFLPNHLNLKISHRFLWILILSVKWIDCEHNWLGSKCNTRHVCPHACSLGAILLQCRIMDFPSEILSSGWTFMVATGKDLVCQKSKPNSWHKAPTVRVHAISKVIKESNTSPVYRASFPRWCD